MGANKLLPLLAGALLVVVMVIALKASKPNGDAAVQMAAVPRPGSPDADSPADTIRTLTAQVAAIKSESNKLQQQNQALLQQGIATN